MKLTAKQKNAVKALKGKQRPFVLAYVGEARGNITKAAEIAGYANPGSMGHATMKIHSVQAAIESFNEPEERSAVATRKEILETLSNILRNEGEHSRERMKAAEVMCKMRGDFLERKQVEHTMRDMSDQAIAAKLDELKGKL